MRLHVRRVAMTFLVSSSLLGVAACSKHARDETIAKDVESKIAADPATKDSSVTVTAQDGKITLKGTAKDPVAQQRVDQIAHEEPGATGVDDEVSVLPQVPEPAANAAPPAPPVEQPKPQPVVVPAGTAVTVTVAQSLSSKTSKAGQQFLATVTKPIMVGGKAAIPKGAGVTGTVITAKEKGRIKGEGELVISLTDITIHGENYSIQTVTLDSTVKGKGKRTAATTGGGAAGGALIGGLTGGGKGAGIGAAVGAAGGLVGGAFTGNKQIEIPAETPLTFTLAKSLTLPPRPE